MNSRHANMRFTFETEVNDSINFVGLSIAHKRSGNSSDFGYATSVYRKPTSNPLFTNFNSFIPLAYLLSVFRCLLHRAKHLCSSWYSFHSEISSVRSMLLRNAFPAWILDRLIKSFVNECFDSTRKFGPHKERFYVGLPFRGKSTDLLRRAVQRISRQFIPTKEVIVFSSKAEGCTTFFD